jgi:hypothetical protein
MLEMQREATATATTAATGAPPLRIDWRTGKPMVERDDAFWQEQERRRLELNISVPQFCAANGLALSTFRHRVYGKNRTAARATAPVQAAKAAASFIAVTTPREPCTGTDVTVELALVGMTLRLCGNAAERVVDRVLERLA